MRRGGVPTRAAIRFPPHTAAPTRLHVRSGTPPRLTSFQPSPPASFADPALTGTLTGFLAGDDGAAATAQLDLTVAFVSLAALTPCPTIDVEVGGTTLTPGVCCAGTISVTGVVTLNGSATDVWVFQIGSTLTTAEDAVIALGGDAQAGNVYWLVGSSATLGIGSDVKGNILALTSITFNDDTTLLGRALAQNGTVVLGTGNTITLP